MSRASIKRQVVALLDATVDFNGRTYASQVYPISELNLPAVRVYYGEETVDEESQALVPPWIRTALINVDIILFANSLPAMSAFNDLDDELNRLKQVVEAEFRKDHTFSGEAISVTLIGSTAPELSGDADKPAVLMTVIHGVTYDE